MNKNFVKDAFIKWLSINNHRFHNPPCNIKKSDKIITFNLTNITPILEWMISEHEVFLTVCHKIPFDSEDDFWDGLIDLEVYEAQSKTGEYYCSGCEGQYRRYYPTKLALWESHSFEALLKWSNENITADKILALYQYGKGGTSAFLLSTDEWEIRRHKHKDNLFKVIQIKID